MRKLSVVLLFGLILLSLSLFGCKVKKYDIRTNLTVDFVIGDDVYKSATVTRGAYLSTPKVNDRSGFIFDGWYSDDDYEKSWEFNSVVYKDMTLYGRWLSETEDFAEVTFTDGDKILSEQRVQKGKRATEFEPDSIKTGYQYGGWALDGQAFDFSTAIHNDTELNLIWSPEQFFVDFYCDGVKIDSRAFTAENLSIDEPSVPYKADYDGVWEDYELSPRNVRVNAVYTPSVYHIRFYALGKIVSEAEYTCEDEKYPVEPQVPELTGHTGKWKDFEIVDKTVNVFAEYEKMTYELTYVVCGNKFKSVIVEYTEVPVDSPTVPPRLGYLCEWESFEFAKDANIIINAVYTPETYHATFVADGNAVAEIPFNIENLSVKLPDIPEKDGYTAAWERFELSLRDTQINAVYTPIEYKATFVADGEIISVQTFNAENMSVTTPPPVNKPEYNCSWEDYELKFEDIVVNAVFIPIEKELGLSFSLSENGLSYTVSGYSGSDKHIIIPQYYRELPVKRIGSDAFAFCELESVTISYGVEAIDERAFYCCTVTEISLPQTIESIGSYAFAESGLICVTLYGDIGEGAFHSCKKLESVTVSKDVKLIAPYAFSNCTALQNFKFESAEGWAVSKDAVTVVGNIPTNKLADSAVAATLYEPMSNYYWIKKSAA